MTTLALIRHGETDWNKRGLIQGITDVPLNDAGLAQASSAARQLEAHRSGLGWAATVTSPLVRAVATGQVIADSLGIPMLEPMHQLAERNYGAAEGVSMAHARELYPTGDYPESESNDLVLARSLNAIDELRRRYDGNALVVVAHGGLLHTLLSRLHGIRQPSIENAKVNVIEYVGDHWEVREVNGESVAVEASGSNTPGGQCH